MFGLCKKRNLNYIYLIRCVDDWIVGRKFRQFISPVKVDSVDVEEEAVLDEEHVHVDGDQDGDDEERGRA